MRRSPTRFLPVLASLICLASPAAAASCGDTATGFEAWKADFAKVARKAGVKRRGLEALAQAQYATRTIAADRNQKSFRYTLEKFLQVRGAETIVAQARRRKAAAAAQGAKATAPSKSPPRISNCALAADPVRPGQIFVISSGAPFVLCKCSKDVQKRSMHIYNAFLVHSRLVLKVYKSFFMVFCLQPEKLKFTSPCPGPLTRSCKKMDTY